MKPEEPRPGEMERYYGANIDQLPGETEEEWREFYTRACNWHHYLLRVERDRRKRNRRKRRRRRGR